MNKKGYIYTVVVIVFVLVLLAVLSLYYNSYNGSVAVDSARVRTDELNYFVEACKKDLSRAMSSSGRKAAIYLSDYAITNNAAITNPEDRIEEAMLNGEMNIGGTTVKIPRMQNQSLDFFASQLENLSKNTSFRSNISVSSIDVYAFDSWHFIAVATLQFNVSDSKDLNGKPSRYENPDVKVISLVSIEGMEDSFYALETGSVIGRVISSSNRTSDYEVVETGAKGNGTGGGAIYDISNYPDQSGKIISMNQTNPGLVHYTLFVIDDYNALSMQARDVLRSSGGVICYSSGSLDGHGFPYVSVLPERDYTSMGFLALKNDAQHQVVRLNLNRDITERLYRESRDGPCFFDRLSKKEILSQKYRDQSIQISDLLDIEKPAKVGLESFVNVSEFSDYGFYASGALDPFVNQSSVDYEYFSDVNGKWVYGTPPWFRLNSVRLKELRLTKYVYDPSLAARWSFDEGSGTPVYDSSRNGNKGTIHGATWKPKDESFSLDFDGINDFVQFEDSESLDISSDITITLWVKPENSQPKRYATILSKHGNGGYTIEQNRDNTNQYYFAWDPKGNGIWTGNDVVTSLTPEVWQHFTVVKEGIRVTLYVDGTQVATGTGYNETIGKNNLPLKIGDYSLGGLRQFSGEISNVKIWNRALTSEEILDDYKNG